ncbi:MAG: methylated-DNA--[protein]-cysteine S-methyltransferase [Cytophagaceae bacterium]|nr:methylated-DNA--[protein]-cysteine S-methyltransferase [Gemmatimonadaceae bacterium]
MSVPAAHDERYLAIVRRDRHVDGSLWFGVTTTHVFCRPSCACRTPLPAHVEYFEDPAAALRAGFRPCKRCRPLGPQATVALAEQRIATPMGDMVAIGTDHGLALLEFADRPMLRTQRERVRTLFGSEIIDRSFPCLDDVRRQLEEYFAGARRGFDLPLLPLGTPFQRLVWDALLTIPSGHTTSYEALATRVGRPSSPRAVGRANGDNRMAIIIPCHRVIGSDGNLTGYGGGLWRKQALLELEGAMAGAPQAAIGGSRSLHID